MGKIRYYQAYLSIAAQGPLNSKEFENHIRSVRQRAFSNSEFTTAGVDLLRSIGKRVRIRKRKVA